MPQGRVLTSAERDDIARLVEKLFVAPKELRLAGAAQTMSLVASNYKFTTGSTQNPTMRVAQGASVKISLTSAGGAHDWVLANGSDGTIIARTPLATGGTPVTVDFTAGPVGNHVYYCSVGSHRVLGMEGRFVIEAP